MKPLTAAATGMTNIKFGSTLFNDQLADKPFDFQFVNPPYGYKWSKDYDAVTIREPMQNNPSVRHRLGQRGLKPETLPATASFILLIFHFSTRPARRQQHLRSGCVNL